MSFGAVPRAVGHTVVGVSWRLAVFLAVWLCFNTLIQLRQWYTSFARSEAWAAEADNEKELVWAPEIAAAARVMPSKTYPTKERFYKEILSHIKADGSLAGRPAVANYRKLRVSRQNLEDDLQKRIDAQEKVFLQKSLLLRDNTQDIADFDATIEHLKDIKKRDPIQEKVLTEAKRDLQQAQAKAPGLRAEVLELVTGRGTIEIGFQKQLAILTSQIKGEEEGIREAFDAVSVPARPVNHLSARLQPLALQIGDEANPLHVFYLIAWYGLEAVIVLLLCGILVPWLLRLYGEASDPKAVQSKVTQWLKDLLSKAFPERVVAALAMAVVGSAAAAGVAIAAGDQPSILPPIWHDGAAVAGAKGERGEPGQPGGSGAPGQNGQNGEDGEDGKCDQCPGIDLTELQSQLERQAAVIEELKGKLAEVNGKADQNVKDVLKLNRNLDVARRNINGLSDEMTWLNRDMSSLSGSIGGLYSANQSILELSNADRRQVLGSLYRLEGDALSKASQIDSLRKAVDQAAGSVQPVASDVLWINAVPDGAWARASPFHRYKVTPQVVEIVDRTMKGVDADQKEMILAALNRLEKKDRMRVGSFKNELRINCAPAAYDTLRQWTPLIVKLSRVQEQRHG